MKVEMYIKDKEEGVLKLVSLGFDDHGSRRGAKCTAEYLLKCHPEIAQNIVGCYVEDLWVRGVDFDITGEPEKVLTDAILHLVDCLVEIDCENNVWWGDVLYHFPDWEYSSGDVVYSEDRTKKYRCVITYHPDDAEPVKKRWVLEESKEE